jgi:hypothetical protein
MATERSRRAGVLIASTVIAMAAAAVASGGARTVVRAASPIAFATATVVDPINLYGEPDLRFDPSRPGFAYASGPWGTGTQRSIWNQSQDGTRTFRELHDLPDPLHAGGSLHGPGGGDTEIAVDHTGKFYGADLGALVTQHTTVSGDRGKTFQTEPLPDAFKDPQLNGTDRQWFGLWDPPNGVAKSAYKGPFPVNYMVYLEALGVFNSTNQETVVSSVPTHSGDSSSVGLNYSCAPGQLGTAACPGWTLSGDGYVFLDQLTGKVVQAIDFQDPAVAGAPDQAAVEVVTPGADGYMNKVDTPTVPGPRRHIVATLQGASTQAIFPVIAQDSQRNAYYVWVERPHDNSVPRTARSWQVFYSWSPPGPNSDWNQWSPPIQVSTPPSVTAIMPWAVAGGNGNLDIAWYGTDKAAQNPESDNDPATAAASWFVYMAQVHGATTSSPQITQLRAVDHPMHHGSICLEGLNCITIQGNRNLADFFEVTTDRTGAAYIVFNNTANDLIQQTPVTGTGVPEGVVDHKGAEVVMVARQVSGPGLFGTNVSAPTDIGVSGISARAGDALYPAVNGTDYPGLDIVGSSLVASGDHLQATIRIVDPSKIAAAAQAIGAPFVDILTRWEYKSNLYFAAVEVPASGQPAQFFDGASQTIDLCSVSACDPHVLTYPGPAVAPLTSHLATGTITLPSKKSPGSIVIDVPRSDVGGPVTGDRLDSVGSYSLVQLTSAFVPMTNAAALNDEVPVEVDGACCFTPILAGAVVAPHGVATAAPGAGAGGGAGSSVAGVAGATRAGAAAAQAPGSRSTVSLSASPAGWRSPWAWPVGLVGGVLALLTARRFGVRGHRRRE